MSKFGNSLHEKLKDAKIRHLISIAAIAAYHPTSSPKADPKVSANHAKSLTPWKYGTRRADRGTGSPRLDIPRRNYRQGPPSLPFLTILTTRPIDIDEKSYRITINPDVPQQDGEDVESRMHLLR